MNNNIDELNELRSQYNLLSEELNRQEIINDKYIKAAIDKNVTGIEYVRKRSILLELLGIISFNFLAIGSKCLGGDFFSWTIIIFVNIMIIVEYFTNKELYKILELKDLRAKRMKDYLLKIKEYRRKNNICRKIAYIFGIILAMMLAFNISRGDTLIFIINCIIILGIAIPIDFVQERKINKHLKELEDIINDINQ